MELSWQLIIKIFILFSLISDYLPNVSAIHEQETWTLCKSKRFRFGNFYICKTWLFKFTFIDWTNLKL